MSNLTDINPDRLFYPLREEVWHDTAVRTRWADYEAAWQAWMASHSAPRHVQRAAMLRVEAAWREVEAEVRARDALLRQHSTEGTDNSLDRVPRDQDEG